MLASAADRVDVFTLIGRGVTLAHGKCRKPVGSESGTLQWMRPNRPTVLKGRHFEAEIILLCVRWYPAVRAQLPESGRNDGRAESPRRPCHHVALGAALRAGIRLPLPPGIAHNQRFVEGRRNVFTGSGQVEYLYRPVDSAGVTIGLLLSARRVQPPQSGSSRKPCGRQATRVPE